ncbi:4Fe-4S dicluster domain-containing protein [Paludibacter sp.]|uniref:4Fe-4S dicluster domain-containing protein n=1 Tax=Paludibacter sp. TaxID=1898105 RepID=UPI00135339AB|nr:4Fe-4S dicluster domain-containing protein [Paludibacter sp.]MTK53051.1 4Fe-4S dicluster domain-containing protein [Paludibacter sp.]
MTQIQPELTEDIKKYGAFDFTACYNCGNCTAVCNLTEKNSNFPRMMVRYSMLGLKEEILSSKELWMCYACGECSDTCPREAGPGVLMSNLRRYAIANYEKTGLTRLMFKNNPFFIAITLILAVVLAFFLLTIKPDTEVARWLFRYVPYEVLHSFGMGAFALMGLSAFVGVVVMWRHIGKEKKIAFTGEFFKKAVNAAKKVIGEVATLKRYQNCDSDSSIWSKKAVWLRPWFVHWTIMWGFIGLLVATTLDFIFKDPATTIWWPSRILGTIAGILMVYGSTVALNYRFRKITKTYANTLMADWMFLGFLWLAGITGFWLEIAVAMGADLFINHVVLMIHIIISMELVILFAFSKFAHAFYRPLALFMHNL